RMLQAKRLKVMLADEKQAAVADCLRRRGIIAAIENRQFGDRATGAIDRQYLLASSGRALEDAHVASLHDVEPGTRFALREDDLARTEPALHQVGPQKLELLVGKAGKDWHAFQERDG